MRKDSYKNGNSIWSVQKLTHELVGSMDKCSRCGEKRTKENSPGKNCIVVHHIDGDRDNNMIDNLLVLCQSCHFKLHSLQEDWFGAKKGNKRYSKSRDKFGRFKPTSRKE